MKAVWMQDWVGTYEFPEGVRLLWNWELNRGYYPEWDRMIADWAKDGVRPMVYMNPYYANLTGNPDIKNNVFQELDSKGYLVKNDQNSSYLIKSVSIKFGMIDFTNEAARNWTKNAIIENMIKTASSVGWMHDFAEYTPLDGVFKGGNNPNTYHNRYPYEWAKVTQEAI